MPHSGSKGKKQREQMNFKLIFHVVFMVAVIVSGAITCSGAVSWIMRDPVEDVLKLTLCGLILVAISLTVVFLTRIRTDQERKAGRKEGFAIVAFSWIVATLIGAVPYVAVTGIYWYDAVFES